MLSIPNRARRGALAAIFIAAALNAHAQQPAASGTLEEIVVTAQKREQNSQDIGISLSAISGADRNSLRAVTVDRVEVLRGPQGTLFSRNATGGLANFNGLAQIYPGLPRWFKGHATYKL